MTEREHLWQRIQTEAPDLAQFLAELKATFGRVTLLEVTWK